MTTVHADFDKNKTPWGFPLIWRFLLIWLPAMLVLAAVIRAFYVAQEGSIRAFVAMEKRSALLSQRLWIVFTTLALILTVAVWAIAFYSVRRKLAEANVRASEIRFRTLLESAPDAIVTVNRDGRITLVNAQAENHFRYTREELLGQPVEMLVPDALRSRHVAYRADYVVDPHTRPLGIGMELYGRRKDGSAFPVEISLSPMQTPQGLVVTAIIRDITSRKDIERELQRRSIELEAINRELKAFSYSVSHDLRAPLRAIDGFSHILLTDYADRLDDTGRSHLERVRRAAQNMGILIDDLLKLSRVTRTELKHERVDLSALANEIAEELRKQGPDRIAHFTIAPGTYAERNPKDARSDTAGSQITQNRRARSIAPRPRQRTHAPVARGHPDVLERRGRPAQGLLAGRQQLRAQAGRFRPFHPGRGPAQVLLAVDQPGAAERRLGGTVNRESGSRA